MERRNVNELAENTVAISDFVWSAATLAEPSNPNKTTHIGLCLRNKKDPSKKIVLSFASDEEFCEVMSSLVAAAKDTWPRGWQEAAGTPVPVTDCKATRGLTEAVNAPGSTFDALCMDEEHVRVALMSHPDHEAPPDKLCFVANRATGPNAKPILGYWTSFESASSFMSAFVQCMVRLWPGRIEEDMPERSVRPEVRALAKRAHGRRKRTM